MKLLRVKRFFFYKKFEIGYTLVFISNAFISVRLKLAKNHTKAKQHPEVKLLLFENYSFSSPTLSSKKIGDIHSKKYTKNKCVCFIEVI